MSTSVVAAFQREVRTIKLADVIPIKTVTPADRKTETYRRIASSIEYVGLVESLVVFPTGKGNYLLLDGTFRYDILLARNVEEARCLLSTEDESYTYNKRVNHIPPIAQHYMILKALEHVSEEKIARALNVSVAAIRAKRDLLNGICPEAVEILRDHRVAAEAFCALRKMKPVRQTVVARLMVNSHKFSGRFAKALLDGTPDEFLVEIPHSRRKCLSPLQQATMVDETEAMLKHVESIQASYGTEVIHLTAACAYVQRLLRNARVGRYLAKHHPDTLAALQEVLADVAAEKLRRPPSKEVRRRKAAAV